MKHQLIKRISLAKLILPLIVSGVILVVYFTYFAPYKELGSFESITPGAEVNQVINVRLDKTGKFGKDAKGDIISFYATDKEKDRALVTSRDPILPEVTEAEILKLFGHMHGNNFVAAKISIIK